MLGTSTADRYQTERTYRKVSYSWKTQHPHGERPDHALAANLVGRCSNEHGKPLVSYSTASFGVPEDHVRDH